MKFTTIAWNIFNESIVDYHKKDRVDCPLHNPYPIAEKIKHLLYEKNWIDTVQWHLEDIIRNPEIDPVEALKIKRWIDRSNQERTDAVELIDDWFFNRYKAIKPLPEATINTESPAWGIDRFSILALKIYHMKEEVSRKDASPSHLASCQEKLRILNEQQRDLGLAIEQLIEDIESGKKYMKVYKQMKMYNDEELNPVLRNRKNPANKKDE